VNKAIRIIEYFIDLPFLEFVLKNPINELECGILKYSLNDILNNNKNQSEDRLN
jgi:hypothetical protein